MSLKNSCAKTENHFTFQDLGNVINIWTEYLTEQEGIFNLQCKENNRLTMNVAENAEKTQLDQTLEYGNYVYKRIEDILKTFEKEIPDETKIIPLDLYRCNMYNSVYDINVQLDNMCKVIDEYITSGVLLSKEEILSDPVETIAQLLQSQLQELEYIELKTYAIVDKINEVEYYKQQLLKSLKIKENKAF